MSKTSRRKEIAQLRKLTTAQLQKVLQQAEDHEQTLFQVEYLTDELDGSLQDALSWIGDIQSNLRGEKSAKKQFSASYAQIGKQIEALQKALKPINKLVTKAKDAAGDRLNYTDDLLEGRSRPASRPTRKGPRRNPGKPARPINRGR